MDSNAARGLDVLNERTKLVFGFAGSFLQAAEEFLLLAALQGFGASDHFGMPAWEPRVRAAMDRLRGQDPAFVERLRAVYKIDFSEILQRAPAIVHDDLPEVERALLNAPY